MALQVTLAVVVVAVVAVVAWWWRRERFEDSYTQGVVLAPGPCSSGGHFTWHDGRGCRGPQHCRDIGGVLVATYDALGRRAYTCMSRGWTGDTGANALKCKTQGKLVYDTQRRQCV